jgi:hypothetical protein
MRIPHAARPFARKPLVAALVVVGLVGAACGSRTVPPATGSPLSTPALKIAVLDAVGHLSYCDPDTYPIGRDPVQAAEGRLPTIQADASVYDAILKDLNLSPGTQLTQEQVVAVSAVYNQMQEIELTADGARYRFNLLVQKDGSPTGNERVKGTVAKDGTVGVDSRGPGERFACPVCLAEGALISTPAGPVAVQDIRNGMRVWSTDRRGRRIAAVVLRTGSMLAPPGHEVVRLRLADGRTVVVSPGHPTADGRTVGDLAPGDRYDGSVVASAALLPYTGARTFDLLPSGPTGTYLADGILLGSTLFDR